MAVVVVTAVMAVVVVIVVESVSILEYIPRLLIHLLATEMITGSFYRKNKKTKA